MSDPTRRERLLTFLLLPTIVVAVLVLAGIMFRSSFQLERLREQSVVEATLLLANEKADRLDKRIIEQDNAVRSIVDVAERAEFGARWIESAALQTPTVRAVLLARPHLAGFGRGRRRVARSWPGERAVSTPARALHVARHEDRRSRRTTSSGTCIEPTAVRRTSSAIGRRSAEDAATSWSSGTTCRASSTTSSRALRRRPAEPHQRRRCRRARRLRTAARARGPDARTAVRNHALQVDRQRDHDLGRGARRCRAAAARARDGPRRAFELGRHFRPGRGRARRSARAAALELEERLRRQRVARAQDAALARAHVRRALAERTRRDGGKAAPVPLRSS